MGFFDWVREQRRDWVQSVEEERVKSQIRAYEESKLTDEYVTMQIMGDGELEKMTRAGWDTVTKVTASEHAFLNEYLIRRRRTDLARSLGLDA